MSECLPTDVNPSPDVLLERFVQYAASKGFELYPTQEAAILALYADQHAIVQTPTGSGKSLIALALHFKSIAQGKRSFYTAPIKALVAEKFFALCDEFGAERVGFMTGDASINRDAPLICCTAEILAKIALHEWTHSSIDTVVIDEFHFYGDRERGVAWQIPLLVLKNAQFCLMSATLGDVSFFASDLHMRTGREVAVIESKERPVPLEFEYSEKPLLDVIYSLVEEGKAPIYVVQFTQKAACDLAQALTSCDFAKKEQKKVIREAIGYFKWDTPFSKELLRYLQHGVGVHHAGLLPKYRLLIEKLAQRGLLSVISGTDTLGVGINVPIRTVVFTQLHKFDGTKHHLLSVREFQQIAGRAGRKGFDEKGYVIVQAPEHVIENKVALLKAAGDPKKLRKIVFKHPPEKGYVHWDENVFRRLVNGQPERLESQFRITGGMLLEILSGAYRRGEKGCQAIRYLIRESHEPKKRKYAHARHAIQLFRSLWKAGIVEMPSKEKGSLLRVHEELQEDFSLHSALSLFIIEAAKRLHPWDATYPLDLLTIVEATLEDPWLILQRQLDKLREEKLAELKALGVPYEERIQEIEKIELPKPKLDFLMEEFEHFVRKHPWISQSDLKPKSIARDIFENGFSFNEYVKQYGLERSEGILLRYLSDAYKAIRQSVPRSMKTEGVLDLEAWLRNMVFSVDSSLLEEWDRLSRGDIGFLRDRITEAMPVDRSTDITEDPRAFVVMMRNASFRFVQRLAQRRYGDASRLVEWPNGCEVRPEEIEAAIAPYWEEYASIRTDAEARAPKHTRIEEVPGGYEVRVALLDEEGVTDWEVGFYVDKERARRAAQVVLELLGIGRAGKLGLS
ncbi:MAG: DUF3516 domain-containing protein [Sandaracinaceae bacterium]|nr:DUF3516 domain-containing protein [Sandaracinaceae bacterium]